MPIAVGAAHAVKIKRETRVVACFFGDGAVNRGPFLEALNWAAIHALPILFVCEDNRWSATTPTDAMTAGEGALARSACQACKSTATMPSRSTLRRAYCSKKSGPVKGRASCTP
jgi:TPP-dependent pyruvate/acetoin dehydrogenase alpha subunit